MKSSIVWLARLHQIKKHSIQTVQVCGLYCLLATHAQVLAQRLIA